MGLEQYRRKRDFSRTPEPAGTARPRRRPRQEAAAGLGFVVQKHAARRLHYDFRLEMDGVLKSWAVPKGPSLDPHEKRLAVQVEDHPLEYGGFEGIIPEGEYGGGTVQLWDRGTWRSLEGEPLAAWSKGKLKLELHGEKLRGGWTLVRMTGARAGDNHENWLLIKENDDTALPGSDDALVRKEAKSVASGQTIEEIAADPPRVWGPDGATELQPAAGAKGKGTARGAKGRAGAAKGAKRGVGAAKGATARAGAAKGAKRGGDAAKGAKGEGGTAKGVAAAKAAATRAVAPAKATAAGRRAVGKIAGAVPGARRGPLPRTIAPALATLVSAPPAGGQWLHEIKFDGYRVVCEVARGKARLLTRHGKDWTGRFPPVAAAAAELPVDSLALDGEVTVLLPDGKTSFQALQESFGEGGGLPGAAMVYFVFDLLYLDGYDLRPAPLAERKEALRRLLEAAGVTADGGPLRWSDHVTGQGEDFYRHACRYGLEGIVSKRADLPYRAGRSKEWLKVKCLQRQEMVIGGFTDPEGARAGLGALLLGAYEDGKLVYAGKVGTGFTAQVLLDLRRRLEPSERRTPPFANPPRGAEARGAHWVEPKLVCEVAFTEWTRDGHLRHPTFQGLREDKPAREVRRELPEPPPAAARPAGGREPAAAAAAPAAPAAPKAAGARSKAVEVAGVRLTHPDKVLFPDRGLTKRDVAEYYERIAGWILPRLADRLLVLVRCPEGQAGECFYQKHLTEQFPAAVLRVPVEEGGKKVSYGAIDSLPGLVSLVQMGVLEIHIWGAHRDQIERPDYAVFDLDPDVGLPWERVAEAALGLRNELAEAGLRSFLKSTGGKGLHVVLPLARRHTWDELKDFTHAVAEGLAASQPDRYTTNPLKARRKGRIFVDYLRNGRGATSIAAYSTRSRPGAPVSTPLAWEELAGDVRADTYTIENLPERLESQAVDPWHEIDEVKQSLTAAIKRRWGIGK
ncbi:MAG TPA: DNA ligase D [Thermoanaerobaculia bacterium]|nr:DNA ligase D [Thermoanaerobaculia bacterium]